MEEFVDGDDRGIDRSLEVGAIKPWLSRRLLAWFAKFQRDLPWRLDRDPYRIWVSEIMLQQTQVATVIPYFERFLQTFPTLHALAAAEEQEVLRLWEGLGYYRRARNLHQAARELAATQAGQIPNDPEILGALPGMGRYTVGAVLSQAFDNRLPILEANSRRVLCRLFGRRDDPQRGLAQRWLWQTADALLPARRVGEFNQALMELGALVCTPSAPHCESCPLAARCVARRLNLQEHIPARPTPPRIEEVQEVAVVIHQGPLVLLVQRPAHGRWAGLWEFPHVHLQPHESHEQAAQRCARELANLAIDLQGELVSLRHSITRFRVTLICFEARYQSGRFRSSFYSESSWIEPAQLPDYPVSSPQRRLAQALVQEARQRSLF